MNHTKGALFVLIGAGCFGFTPIFVKWGFHYNYSLGQLNIAQMLVAFIFLWGIVLFKRPSAKNVTKQNIIKSMITGSFVGLTSIFYYGSMQYLPASLAIILLFQFVWIGVIFEWLFSKIKPTLKTIIAIIITLMGVFFASNVLNGSFQELPMIGFILGFLAAFSYAGFIFLSGKVATTVSPWYRTPFMVTGSTILILLVFIPDIPTVRLNEGMLWMTSAGIALFGAILPPLFFALGAPKITGGLANILSSIELPVAIISANVILSESVTILQWLGIFLILFAIFINEYGYFLIRSRARHS